MSVNFRLDLLQLSLSDAIRQAMPADTKVVWTAQVPVRDNNLWVTMNQITGPVDVARAGKKELTICLPDDATLTIDSAAEGSRYFARVNGVDYYTDGLSGDTVTTIRDRLANEMQDDEGGTEPYVTATDSGADAIILLPDTPGSLWDLAADGPLTAVASSSESAYKVKKVTKRLTVSLQVFSRDTSPRSGATFHMNNIVSALEEEKTVQAFSERCLAIRGKGTPIPDNVLVGTTTWESRSVLDLDLVLRSVTVIPVGTVTSVKATIEARLLGSGAVVSTETITIPSP